MSGNRWPRVKELFHAALARSPAERAAFLAGACNGDTLLVAEVQRLLAAHAQVGDFMEQSPASLTGVSDATRWARCSVWAEWEKSMPHATLTSDATSH